MPKKEKKNKFLFHFSCSFSYNCKLYYSKISFYRVELAWSSGCVMDCHPTIQGSIPSRVGVKTEFHVLRKGQLKGALSLNDLAVDGKSNTTNQHLLTFLFLVSYIIIKSLFYHLLTLRRGLT